MRDRIASPSFGMKLIECSIVMWNVIEGSMSSFRKTLSTNSLDYRRQEVNHCSRRFWQFIRHEKSLSATSRGGASDPFGKRGIYIAIRSSSSPVDNLVAL